MFTQFDPMIPLHVTNRGEGQAFAVIDYCSGHNVICVPTIPELGDISCASNHTDRMQFNFAIGRPLSPALEAFKCKADPVNFRGEDNPGPKEVAQ